VPIFIKKMENNKGDNHNRILNLFHGVRLTHLRAAREILEHTGPRYSEQYEGIVTPEILKSVTDKDPLCRR
jgi:hypothetical protein